MTLTLLLPWFPILLAVGLGGRLLGRGRGFALGLVCAMFWVVLVQAAAGTGIWRQPGVVVTIVIGAVAIFLMGGWAGTMSINERSSAAASALFPPPSVEALREDPSLTLDSFAAIIHQFDDWLAEHRDDS